MAELRADPRFEAPIGNVRLPKKHGVIEDQRLGVTPQDRAAAGPDVSSVDIANAKTLGWDSRAQSYQSWSSRYGNLPQTNAQRRLFSLLEDPTETPAPTTVSPSGSPGTAPRPVGQLPAPKVPEETMPHTPSTSNERFRGRTDLFSGSGGDEGKFQFGVDDNGEPYGIGWVVQPKGGAPPSSTGRGLGARGVSSVPAITQVLGSPAPSGATGQRPWFQVTLSDGRTSLMTQSQIDFLSQRQPGLISSITPSDTAGGGGGGEFAAVYDEIVQKWFQGGYPNTKTVLEDLQLRLGLKGPEEAKVHFENFQDRLTPLTATGAGPGGPGTQGPRALAAGAAAGGDDPADFGRRAQFLQSRGLQAVGGGPGNAFRRNQFADFEGLFEQEQRFNLLTGNLGAEGAQNTFANYLASGPRGAGQRRSQAEALLNRVLGAGTEGRRAFGFGFQDAFDDEGNLIKQDPDLGIGAGELRNLLGSGLQRQFGRRGARHIAGRVDVERDAFNQRRLQGAGGPGSFIDFFAEKYGLGQ